MRSRRSTCRVFEPVLCRACTEGFKVVWILDAKLGRNLCRITLTTWSHKLCQHVQPKHHANMKVLASMPHISNFDYLFIVATM